MRFVRFGEPGAEQPGVLDHEGHIRDLTVCYSRPCRGNIGAIASAGPRNLTKGHG